MLEEINSKINIFVHNERQSIEFLRLRHCGERVAQTIYVGQQANLKNQPEAEEFQYLME